MPPRKKPKVPVDLRKSDILLGTDEELFDYNKVRNRTILYQILSTKYSGLSDINKQLIRQQLCRIQENKCAICSNKITWNKAHLNHCHTTDYIRGLLCNRCNFGLGWFKDNKEFLMQAIRYVTSVYNGIDNA
jgi:hypothetical protein